MDIPVHDQIIWRACVLAQQRLSGTACIADPRDYFPMLSRGSWMNDTNQASLFFEAVPRAELSQQLRDFFAGLWRVHLADLLERLRRAQPDGAAVAARAKALVDAKPVHADDLGVYHPADHLDVVKDDAGAEYQGWNTKERKGRAATIHRTAAGHIPRRLIASTVGNDAGARLDGGRVTALGRALHSIADFYAHSNYVELLLWSLAWRRQLPETIHAAFNRQVDSVFEDDPTPCHRTPLPLDAPSIAGLAASGAAMWYGPEPAATPLVSTVFDLRDTVCSLLKIYIANLTRGEGDSKLDDMLDLVMAVYDVPGRPLLEGAISLFEEASDLLRDIGRSVRGKLAAELETRAQSTSGSASGVLAAAASLVRRYDSAQAAKWARAGRLCSIMCAVESDLGAALQGQSVSRPQLPHHTLLAKDHQSGLPWQPWEPSTPHADLRFKLACAMATEVSADLLAWHFGTSPSDGWFAAQADRRIIHPWSQLEEGLLAGDRVVSFLSQATLGDWRDLVLKPGFALFGSMS